MYWPHIMGFGKCIEAFISWANPISKQFSIRVQHSSNGMSIHPWSHGEDVQFIQFWNTLQEIHSSRSDLCMVPHRVTRQLKMMNILWIFNGKKHYYFDGEQDPTLHMHYIIHVVTLQNVNVFIVVCHLNVKWCVHFSCFWNHWRRGNTLEMSGFPSSLFNAYFDKTLTFIKCEKPLHLWSKNNSKATRTTS